MAIVTGAGRGIGRAYARLLGERGATVVVNDLGSAIDGTGADAAPAAAVAEEIIEAGGTALADTSDIATVAGAEALVGHGIDQYGRVDILINNAGIMRWAELADVTDDDLQQHLAVHVTGSFSTARAAWPHMAGANYGRIVMTTSAGMLGLPNNVAYATAKGAVVGLARSLATAGRGHGIKVNLIAPAAFTRMAGSAPGSADMAPELVAPMAAYLAHEDCPVTGEMYTAGAGRYARMFIAETDGYVHDGSPPAIEDVARRWEMINDDTSFQIPADLMAWSAKFTSHLSDDRTGTKQR